MNIKKIGHAEDLCHKFGKCYKSDSLPQEPVVKHLPPYHHCRPLLSGLCSLWSLLSPLHLKSKQFRLSGSLHNHHLGLKYFPPRSTHYPEANSNSFKTVRFLQVRLGCHFHMLTYHSVIITIKIVYLCIIIIACLFVYPTRALWYTRTI